MNHQENESYPVLDKHFWNSLWRRGSTGWDIGQASPPIAEFMQQYDNKKAAILIPGCGNAHEADFMLSLGFENITLLDISEEAVEILRNKYHHEKRIKIICDDFFNHKGQYDLIIEQTFFCTHAPQRRKDYAEQIHSLLKQNGRLVGVLFGIPLGASNPPFGGNEHEYHAIFEPLFEIERLELCYNSFPSRKNEELFIHFLKRP